MLEEPEWESGMKKNEKKTDYDWNRYCCSCAFGAYCSLEVFSQTRTGGDTGHGVSS